MSRESNEPIAESSIKAADAMDKSSALLFEEYRQETGNENSVCNRKPENSWQTNTADKYIPQNLTIQFDSLNSDSKARTAESEAADKKAGCLPENPMSKDSKKLSKSEPAKPESLSRALDVSANPQENEIKDFLQNKENRQPVNYKAMFEGKDHIGIGEMDHSGKSSEEEFKNNILPALKEVGAKVIGFEGLPADKELNEKLGDFFAEKERSKAEGKDLPLPQELKNSIEKSIREKGFGEKPDTPDPDPHKRELIDKAIRLVEGAMEAGIKPQGIDPVVPVSQDDLQKVIDSMRVQSNNKDTQESFDKFFKAKDEKSAQEHLDKLGLTAELQERYQSLRRAGVDFSGIPLGGLSEEKLASFNESLNKLPMNANKTPDFDSIKDDNERKELEGFWKIGQLTKDRVSIQWRDEQMAANLEAALDKERVSDPSAKIASYSHIMHLRNDKALGQEKYPSIREHLEKNGKMKSVVIGFAGGDSVNVGDPYSDTEKYSGAVEKAGLEREKFSFKVTGQARGHDWLVYLPRVFKTEH